MWLNYKKPAAFVYVDCASTGGVFHQLTLPTRAVAHQHCGSGSVSEGLGQLTSAWDQTDSSPISPSRPTKNNVIVTHRSRTAERKLHTHIPQTQAYSVQFSNFNPQALKIRRTKLKMRCLLDAFWKKSFSSISFRHLISLKLRIVFCVEQFHDNNILHLLP